MRELLSSRVSIKVLFTLCFKNNETDKATPSKKLKLVDTSIQTEPIELTALSDEYKFWLIRIVSVLDEMSERNTSIKLRLAEMSLRVEELKAERRILLEEQRTILQTEPAKKKHKSRKANTKKKTTNK